MIAKRWIPTLVLLLTLLVGVGLGHLTHSTASAQADNGYHITSNADGDRIFIWEWSGVRAVDGAKSMTVWRANAHDKQFTKIVIPLDPPPKDEKK